VRLKEALKDDCDNKDLNRYKGNITDEIKENIVNIPEDEVLH